MVQHRKAQQGPAAQDSAAETELVLRAVCATKLPTLTFEDVGRFRGLLGDIFPGTAVTDTTNPELQAVLQQAAADIGLQLTPQQVSVCSLSAAELCGARID
jgi:dynein heavy chain 2